MMWVALIIWFLVWEIVALATREKHFPTLSRWTWRQTARWEIWVVVRKRPRRILPLRIILFVGMSWATIHLSLGECALGIC